MGPVLVPFEAGQVESPLVHFGAMGDTVVVVIWHAYSSGMAYKGSSMQWR